MTLIDSFLRPSVLAIATTLVSSLPASGALLAFYDFNGDANDRSGNAIHPTTLNNVTQVTGYQGQAYEFNGSNSYIRIPLNINPSNHPTLTMGAWVKSDVNVTGKQVISNDNGGFDRTIGIDNRGGGLGWSAFTGTSTVLGYEPVSTGVWTFIAVTYDQANATATLYVNGESFTQAATLNDGNTFTRIGSNPGFGEYFDGVIDNVFFFDEVLSSTRIEQIRLNGASAIPETSTGALALSCLALATLRRRRRS
jgi:MYXO-CTERM domain-containing protein